jgi:hypothetical protein
LIGKADSNQPDPNEEHRIVEHGTPSMPSLEMLYQIIRWGAAVMAFIAAIGLTLALKEYTGKFHSKLQWIRGIATVTAAILVGLSLWMGNQLDQIRTARERASQNELAQLKNAFTTLQTKTTPRTISAVQINQLFPLLLQNPKGTIHLNALSGNVEARRFAEQIASLLQATGWTITHFSQLEIVGEEPIGLLFWVHSLASIPPEARALKENFDAVGLSPTWRIDDRFPKGTFQIIVGHKPP